MDVLVEIGAVAGLAALEVDELDEPGGGEVVEAVIDCRQRNVRGAVLHPGVEVGGSGMVRGGCEHLEDFTTMRGEPDICAEHGQSAIQPRGFGRGAMGGRWHNLELE
jgi:hypothetical protein